jgi:hypothetical protein
MQAPKRRRPIRTGDRTRGMDYCRVWLEPRRAKGRRRGRHGRKLIVSVPLTPRGAVYLDESDKAGTLFALLGFAGLVADETDASTWPTPAELIEEVGELSFRLELVALAGPGDTPPPGAFGYYSDGQQHAAAVVLSAAGRRLFVEHDADEVLRTNVAEYFFSDRE